VLYSAPTTQSPLWSVAGGLVNKRKTNPKEPTVMGSGLIDGMPTGMHFRLMVYDDVIELRSVGNPDMVRKATEAWEMSDNLGAGEVRTWTVGTRYCTIGSMRITMQDWSQKPIEDVCVGDTIVGWELRDGKRWLRPAKVINRGVHRKQPVNKYSFENGRSVVCTDDHKWWRGPHGGGPEYAPLGLPKGVRPDRPLKNKKVNGRLTHIRELMVPIEPGTGSDEGWLAGFFDGEGTVKKNKNHPSAVISFAQSVKNRAVMDAARETLTSLGFEWSDRLVETQENWSDRTDLYVKGGWRERYRFLAQVDPVRRDKIADSLFGQLTTNGRKLVSIEPQEPQDVHWLETETGNYVVEGFCSSNSFADTYGVILDRGVLTPRIYPATDDGSPTGQSVFISEARLKDKLNKQRSTFAAQMLQNPLAGNENTFKAEWLTPWYIRPASLTVYITADPSKGRSASSDRTAIAVIGIDQAGNKYLLDGYRHRMTLSERWASLRDLWKKWSSTPGVQLVNVGYERYGQATDDEYFKERMLIENISFGIKELNWVRDGGQSKKDRVERLEPDFRLGRFYLPGLVYEPGLGECFWELDKSKGTFVKRPMRAPTREMANMLAINAKHRVAKPIRRIDEDRGVYDVTTALMEEMLFFPFSPKDDLVDAASRIYDMQPIGPSFYEDETVARLNNQDFIDA
jgi:hypothetical protein